MINVLRNAKVWALGVAMIGLTVPSAAAQQVPPAQAPTVAPPIPQAAVDRYLVGQARPPLPAAGRLVDMTLDQAMQTALDKNLDLKAARLSPEAVDYQLQAARAAFNPRLTSAYGYNNQKSPNNSTLEGALTTISTIRQTYNGGLVQALPWFGSDLSLNFTNNRSGTNSVTSVLNPNYGSNLTANFSMPILQGFLVDNTRNSVKTMTIERQLADVQLTETIENTKASVRTAYWNLRRSIEQIEIQQRALDLANRLYQDNRVKVEIGTLAPIDTVQSEAQVATAEQQLLNAEISWRTAELDFKRLIVDGPSDALYSATINPTEQAVIAVQSIDIPSAVRTALERRTDLVQTRRQLEISELGLELNRDLTKPQLDFSTSYQLAGQGGQRLSNGIRLPGGYVDALNQIAGVDNPTWNVSFNLNYPIGMRAAKANLARAQLQFEQSQVTLQAQELTVSSDVTNAGLAVENTYKQFQAAQKAREASERNAEAEQTRFDFGTSTNYNVVQAQNNLTSARLNELTAVINYLNAVAEFDRIQRVGGR